jgi:molybdopterin molybdotransferase
VISVEEALERILARVTTLGDERVALLEALDRVLAEPVVAEREVPPWPNSSMDGYAVVSADTRDAAGERPTRLRLAGRVAAGHVADRPLATGETFRILTGAPLPHGADAVIPQEDVEVEGEGVRVPRPVPVGDYVRPGGE